MQIKLNDVVFYVSFATHVAVFYGGISANFHFLRQGRFAIQVINCILTFGFSSLQKTQVKTKVFKPGGSTR